MGKNKHPYRVFHVDSLDHFKITGDIHFPTAPFDPDSDWFFCYGLALSNPHYRPWAYLKLSRKRIASGLLEMTVDRGIAEIDGGMAHLNGHIRYRDDETCSPMAFDVESHTVHPNGEVAEETRFRKTGNIRDGRLRIELNGRTVERPLPGQVASNWTLFDLLQRRPAGQEPLTFTLLDEFDRIKPSHLLSPMGSRDFTINGQPVRLTGYQHIGTGILPYEYWLDEQSRLVLITSEQRLYFHDPEAPAKAEAQRKSRVKDAGVKDGSGEEAKCQSN